MFSQARARIVAPIEEMMKSMLGWGWNVEADSSRSKSQIKRRVSKITLVSHAAVIKILDV